MKHLIVIPAFNEEEALPRTLADLQSLPDDFEVVIVNDGSRDATAQVACELARSSKVPLHIINLTLNGGIGVSVQTGFLFAMRRGCYHYVIQFDADGQHDASYVPELVARCDRDQLDLCLGSRFLEGGADAGYRSSFLRRQGIRWFRWLIRWLTGVKVSDPTSGFRCMGPRVWNYFARVYPEDYPEPESLFWCLRNRLRFGEIPVKMRPRQGGVSSIRKFVASYYMLKVTLSILFDRLRRNEKSS